MKFTRRLTPVVVATLALAAPASAHEVEGSQSGMEWLLGAHHPGWYTPSPESQTKNVKMIGSVVAHAARLDRTATPTSPSGASTVFAGHYDGFQIVDASDPENPRQIVDFAVPGLTARRLGLGGPAVRLGRDAAHEPGVRLDGDAGGARLRGHADLRRLEPGEARLIKGVPTDCGSHTHTLVPDAENGRVLLYVASYTAAPLPESAYGNACLRVDEDGSARTTRSRSSRCRWTTRPRASVVSEPRFPQNAVRRRRLERLPRHLGLHGDQARRLRLHGRGPDLGHLRQGEPATIARIHNPNVEFFHSATFSWDGKTVVYGDEAGGGTQPRCRPQDRRHAWRAVVLRRRQPRHDGRRPTRRGAAEPLEGPAHDQGVRAPNCTMHNFNTLPTTKRDVLVSSAYAAGTTVVDFTDRRNPVEVGHHDPHGANTWSSYWYNGHIYTNDGGRGVDVMLLSDKARAGAQKLPHSNPQTQDHVLR